MLRSVFVRAQALNLFATCPFRCRASILSTRNVALHCRAKARRDIEYAATSQWLKKYGVTESEGWGDCFHGRFPSHGCGQFKEVNRLAAAHVSVPRRKPWSAPARRSWPGPWTMSAALKAKLSSMKPMRFRSTVGPREWVAWTLWSQEGSQLPWSTSCFVTFVGMSVRRLWTRPWRTSRRWAMMSFFTPRLLRRLAQTMLCAKWRRRC